MLQPKNAIQLLNRQTTHNACESRHGNRNSGTYNSVRAIM